MHFLKRGNSIWLLGFSVWQQSSLIPPFIDHAFSYYKNFMIRIHCTRTSLIVQWLRLHAPNAGGLDSIPGQGTRFHMQQLKIPYATTKIKDPMLQLRPAQTKKKKKINSLNTGGMQFAHQNAKADSSYEPVIY